MKKLPAALKAVTVSELKHATGLSRPTIYKLIRQGQFPGYKIGSRYVIPRPWFERYLAGEWTPPPTEEESGESTEPTPIDLLHRRQSA